MSVRSPAVANNGSIKNVCNIEALRNRESKKIIVDSDDEDIAKFHVSLRSMASTRATFFVFIKGMKQ